MNTISLSVRLVSAIIALAVVLAIFDTVVLAAGTLPDVKIARAIQAERVAAASRTMVAAAAPAASAVR